MTVAGHYAAVVVLFLARRVGGSVVEVRDGNLIGGEFGDGFKITATTKDVKRIEHGGGVRMIGGSHYLQRILNGIELLDEPEKFHGRMNADGFAQLEQFPVPAGAKSVIGPALSGASDDVRCA